MSAKHWPWIGLIAVFIVQWTVPASMIWRGDQTLREGQRYYFRTAPVDPVDAFRGRYVVLSFDAATVANPQALSLRRGERVYVPLSVGADRFAVLGAPLPEPPPGPYLEAHVRGTGLRELTLQLPFDRYYIDEHLALAAEEAAREASGRRGEVSRAYVTVKVRDGHAVLEELFIDDVPVHRYLAARPR